MSSRSTVSHGAVKQLSEDEIRNILLYDGPITDDLDYSPDKDLKQGSDTSDGENAMDDVECVHSTCASSGLPHWLGSTQLELPSPSVSPDLSLLGESTCDE